MAQKNLHLTPILLALLVLLPLAAPVPAAGQAACTPGDGAVCLGPDGRVRVEVEWSNPYPPGGAGRGTPGPVRGDSATFWFFRPDNLELVVKVLDGRPVNGHLWLFDASLSTVEWVLAATDTVTGWQRFHRNPPREQTIRQATDAFPPPAAPGSGGAGDPAELLWIGAHPDDEGLVAPVLGTLCPDAGIDCRLLVATLGEAGPCQLPGGCGDDLGALRRQEMERAAAALGATLVQWELPDLVQGFPADVRAGWAAAAGGEEALLSRLAAEMAGAGTVVTFDPRHGSTCHPAHRALGDLVLEAAARLGDAAPAVLLLESVLRVGQGGFVLQPAVPRDERLLGFDAALPEPSPAADAWSWLLRVVDLHASQFYAPARAAFADVPPAERRTYLAPAPPPEPLLLGCGF